MSYIIHSTYAAAQEKLGDRNNLKNLQAQRASLNEIPT
jgi:hypothetical protein